MAERRIGLVVQQLRRLARPDVLEESGDGPLLERFVRQRDEAAFAHLLRRHGPMVLGLCRRRLSNAHDADDVFQATFLLLARRAGSIRKPESVACWLHGVACRLAARLRSQQARRQANERRAMTMRTRPPAIEEKWRELYELLDQALQDLSERYRVALVLCYLEGKTHEEAARQVGCPLATLRSRVARGRELLRRRLGRHGFPLAVAPFAALLAAQPSEAAVPPALLDSTRAAAARLVAGGAADGLVSDAVLALVRGGVRTASVRTFALAGVLLATLGAAVAATTLVPSDPVPSDPPPITPARAARPQPARADRFGDPLPLEALARFGTVRFRQSGDLRTIAFTPDGTVLASCAGDSAKRVVRLSEPATGRILRELGIKDQDSVSCMALTADGKSVVAGGSTWNEKGERVGVIYSWNLATGMQQSRIQGRRPEEWSECLAVSPDGRTLATGSEVFFNRTRPQSIRLWDLTTGKELRELKGHAGPIAALVFTPDGKTLISAGSSRWKNGADRTIRLWDVATGTERRRLEGHQGSVRALALSPDGRTLASGSWDGTARLWDLATGKETARLAGHSGGVYALAFSPDGKRLAASTGYDDVGLRLWDVTTGHLLRSLAHQPRPVEGLAFAPDGKLLVSAGGEGHAIRFWDPNTGAERSPPGGHQADVARVFFAPDGRVLTWSGEEGTLREWDRTSGQERRHFRVPRWVFCAALSPDGRVFAYARQDKVIRLCDWTTGKELAHCRGHTDYLRGLAFSPDGRRLASGGDDKTVRIWDPATGKELRRFTHKDYFHAVTFGADSNTVLWAGINGCLRVWDTETGRERFRSDRVGQSIDGVAVSPDGKLLAKGRPGFVELWDLTTGQQCPSLPGQRPREGLSIANRCSLAFAPDGKMLAVAGWDDRVRLYELATGQERHRLVGHPGRITAVAFSPDGRTLLTGSEDTTALLWDLTGRTDRPARPATANAETLWSDLTQSDSERAYQAMRALMASPREGVACLRAHLRPIPVPDAARLARLLADLDSEQFVARQKATEELMDLGEAAEAALRRHRESMPSLETRRRLDQLLARLEGANRLRESRAVEVLERLGDPDARALLETLAGGLPGAGLTVEAKAALQRLGHWHLGGGS